jgi:hypothetical protein
MNVYVIFCFHKIVKVSKLAIPLYLFMLFNEPRKMESSFSIQFRCILYNNFKDLNLIDQTV